MMFLSFDVQAVFKKGHQISGVSFSFQNHENYSFKRGSEMLRLPKSHHFVLLLVSFNV